MMNGISFIAGTSILIAVLIVVIQGITLAEAVSTSGNTTTSPGSNVTSGTVPTPSSGFSSGYSNYGNPGRCGSSDIPSSSCGAFGKGY